MTFKVIFPRREGYASKAKTPDYAETVSKLAQNYPENTKRIIVAVAGKPHISLKELAEASGLSKSGVKYVLGKLKMDGVVRRIGGSRGGYWEVVA